MEYLTVWLIAVSLCGAAVTVYDKWAAKHRPKKRIRERTLWLWAIGGGSAAMLAVMWVIRHKTRHRQFMWGFPLLIAAQVALLIFLLR